jgi:hypothetical protein
VGTSGSVTHLSHSGASLVLHIWHTVVTAGDTHLSHSKQPRVTHLSHRRQLSVTHLAHSGHA